MLTSSSVPEWDCEFVKMWEADCWSEGDDFSTSSIALLQKGQVLFTASHWSTQLQPRVRSSNNNVKKIQTLRESDDYMAENEYFLLEYNPINKLRN